MSESSHIAGGFKELGSKPQYYKLSFLNCLQRPHVFSNHIGFRQTHIGNQLQRKSKNKGLVQLANGSVLVLKDINVNQMIQNSTCPGRFANWLIFLTIF